MNYKHKKSVNIIANTIMAFSCKLFLQNSPS